MWGLLMPRLGPSLARSRLYRAYKVRQSLDVLDWLALRNRGVDDSLIAAADTSAVPMLADWIGGG